MEEDAANEIEQFLQIIGDNESKIEISEFSGIIIVSTSLNPFDIIEKIRQKILDEPWSIRYCHRFIPIQETTGTSLDDIVKAVQKHLSTMKPADSYRITIEKRGSDLSSKNIIDEVAKIIQNKVSLEKFDWNVMIEVLGKTAGISVLKEQDIVSTLKIKRDSME